MTLIERLEKATGPDRELNADIAEAIGVTVIRMPLSGPHDGNGAMIADYSDSIDAALTLVPDGWGRKCEFGPGFNNSVTVGHVGADGLYDKPEQWASHESEAIALCIAALKARGME